MVYGVYVLVLVSCRLQDTIDPQSSEYTICFPYSLTNDFRNDSATSIFLCFEINRNSKDSIMNWFDYYYYNPKSCIIISISIAYLNQCFIYDKGSYIILAFFLFGKTCFGLNSYCIQYHIMATYIDPLVHKWF